MKPVLNLMLLLPLAAGIAVGIRGASGPWHQAVRTAAVWGAGLGLLVGLFLALTSVHVPLLRTVWNSALVGAVESVLGAALVLLLAFVVRFTR
ncbi:MAG: hypothetical protein AUH75_09770 [Gemmatimonadetes bacterium 13_1_40CM_4_65_7]|nr:MAG: hypothetical protein AUH75_09770 [Gemmatimonadetes bacterium 13_1_40CM_4_65_7]